MRDLRRSPELHLLLLLVACCMAAPLLTSPEPARPGLLRPDTLDFEAILSPPSGRHWLGTDSLGRDLLSRLLEGGRVSLWIALGTAAASVLIGAALGLTAGFTRGWFDALLGRAMDIADSVPTLLLALATVAAGLERGPLPLITVLALSRWTDVARLARAQALSWGATRLEAARASGAGAARMITGHLLPTALPLLATAASLVAVEALEVEAGLGLIGFGIAPPGATWGNLLQEARLTLDEAWWTALFPGAAIFVAVAGLLRIAESLAPQRGVARRAPAAPPGR